MIDLLDEIVTFSMIAEGAVADQETTVLAEKTETSLQSKLGKAQVHLLRSENPLPI